MKYGLSNKPVIATYGHQNLSKHRLRIPSDLSTYNTEAGEIAALLYTACTYWSVGVL